MSLGLSTRIRFLGVAAYEIVTRSGGRILVDPFLDENPGSPLKHTEFPRVDLVIVSHAAFDHLGDTDKIAARYGCPVICGGEVKAWLMAKASGRGYTLRTRRLPLLQQQSAAIPGFI